MQKFSLFILSCLVVTSIHAATDFKSPKRLAVQVKFNMDQPEQQTTIPQQVDPQQTNPSSGVIALDQTWKTMTDNHHWNIIQDSKNPDDRFLLIGRVDKADQRGVVMKFVVLNTTKTPSIITAPQIVVNYGQKGQITLGDQQQKIQLTVTATLGR